MTIKVGTRASNLSILQTQNLLDEWGISCEIIPMKTSGDKDKNTPIENAEDDFFTKEIDSALLGETIDIAVHSAKDLPPKSSDEMGIFYWHKREDRRDAIVSKNGVFLSELSEKSVVGVSGSRRAEFIKKHWADLTVKPIRGTIEERISQVDNGDFDATIIAVAALNRLGLQHRIVEYIPLEFLPTPRTQGQLAITYRKDDKRILDMLKPFVFPSVFVGAGAGDAGLLTLQGKEAIQQADCIIYDRLVNSDMLHYADENCDMIYVGKDVGNHATTQEKINQILVEKVKSGLKVVRLKGGDVAIFSRINEEINALENAGLDYRIVAGVSSVSACSIAAGFSLTNRDEINSFSVATGYLKDNKPFKINPTPPIAIFMGVSNRESIKNELISKGYAAKTPITVVENGTTARQKIIQVSLEELENADIKSPAILYIGYEKKWNILQCSKTVLITASKQTNQKLIQPLKAAGMRVIEYPTISITPAYVKEEKITGYDWTIFTSQNSVQYYFYHLENRGLDARKLGKVMAVGTATADYLKRYNIIADLIPENFSTDGIIAVLNNMEISNKTFILPRSSLSDNRLPDAIHELGGMPYPIVVYENNLIAQTPADAFDIATFCSGSAVHSFFTSNDIHSLKGKEIAVLGKATADTLKQYGYEPTVIVRKNNYNELARAVCNILN